MRRWCVLLLVVVRCEEQSIGDLLERRVFELRGEARECGGDKGTPLKKIRDGRGCRYAKLFLTPDALRCSKALCGGWRESCVPRSVLKVENPLVSEGLAWYAARLAAVAVEAKKNGEGLASDYVLREAKLSTFLKQRTKGRWRNILHNDTMREPAIGSLPFRRAFSPGPLSEAPEEKYFDDASCALQRLLKPDGDRLNAVVPEYLDVRSSLVDKDTLSVGVYVRTLHSEVAGLRQDTVEDRIAKDMMTNKERIAYLSTALCALSIEKKWRSPFKNVTWFVASDSPALRQRFYKDFSTPDRRVAITKAQGLHTRIGANLDAKLRVSHSFNDTLALAEAFADWSLLSTVDVAVLASYQPGPATYTFATTALASRPRQRSVFQAPTWAQLRDYWRSSSSKEDPPELHCARHDGFLPRVPPS